MSGYLDFYRTGFKPFDEVLSLLEEAGSAYHYTYEWGEEGWNGELSYVDQINNKILEAKKAVDEYQLGE